MKSATLITEGAKKFQIKNKELIALLERAKQDIEILQYMANNCTGSETIELINKELGI